MRRPQLHSMILAILATLVSAGACTDPPKPEKASEADLSKIEKTDGEGSTLGPIPTGPVAVVGDVEVPSDRFREVYDLKVRKYTDRGREIPTSADRRYRKSIVERLIYHEVLAQEAAALGVTHDADALAERQEQQKRGIRDWGKHLARRGETEDSLTAMFVAELREKAILEKLGKLSVTEEEIDADYEKIKDNWVSDKPRVRASHILIPTGHGGGPHGDEDEPSGDHAAQETAAKAKAEELHKLVTAQGADFESIAREHSTGPSAAKGGDIGIFTADRMAEEFSAVAFKLNAGDISKPVKTKFGYHIIKVTGKWPAGGLPKEALRDQIVTRLEQRKLHQGRRELKDELLAKYKPVDHIAPTLGPEPESRSPRPAVVDPRKAPERRKPTVKGAKDADDAEDGAAAALVEDHGHGHAHDEEE